MKSLKDLMNLKGRVAIITGGAGHLGIAVAEALAELGCCICIVDKPGSLMTELCENLKNRWPIKAESIGVDLENEDERSKLLMKVVQLFGQADVLVNNAAFVGDSELKGWAVSLEEQQIGTWRRALEVNLTATFHLSQIFAPMLRATGKGSIINIGSIYGVLGPDLSLYEGTSMGNPAAYSASKGGVIQLTRWMSTVLAPEVRVNSISPGGILRRQAVDFVNRYSERTPLRRMGVEEDFKGAVAYFASDLSSWVTGQNLMVDGGWTAW